MGDPRSRRSVISPVSPYIPASKRPSPISPPGASPVGGPIWPRNRDSNKDRSSHENAMSLDRRRRYVLPEAASRQVRNLLWSRHHQRRPERVGGARLREPVRGLLLGVLRHD